MSSQDISTSQDTATSMFVNGSTSVYPPQPYGSMSDPSAPINGTDNKSDPSPMDASPNGTMKKRSASSSPSGSDTKEKRPRSANDDASPTQANSTNGLGITGTTNSDNRAWGEEATKLDVYVWDYLIRRGFARAAQILIDEAGMTDAPDVPLKTPQGLLFEYWAIFWDVFAARTGRGSADAASYHELQETRLAQKINDTIRRSESMEANFSLPNSSARFPPVVTNASRPDSNTTGAAPVAAGMPASFNHMVRPFNGSAAQQPTGVRPGIPPGAMTANANNGVPASQQSTQLLLLAAQRQNIPFEELEKMNPAMRTALIQSVVASTPQGGAAGIRPGYQGNAHSGAFDQGMQQRIQAQQQMIQRQGSRNLGQQPMRPGMQVQQAPGTPGAGTPNVNGQGMPDARIPTGQQQPSGIPGQPQQQPPTAQQAPDRTQPSPFSGGSAPGMNVSGPPTPARPIGGQLGNANMDRQENQGQPRLTTEQHQMLLSQFQSMQQSLRQEVWNMQNAPTPEVAQRSAQNAQQIQMRLAQLGALLKSQPGLQHQTNMMMQQQQQQQQQQPGQQPPSGPNHGNISMGVGAPFRPSLTPQQQQLLAQQQQRVGQPSASQMTQSRLPPGAAGHDPNSMMGGMMPHGAGMMNGQVRLQQPHAQPFGNQSYEAQARPQQGTDMQQRASFAFANPFAAGAGGRRPSNAPEPDPNFQQPQPPYMGQQQIRPNVMQRPASGMGPPAHQHISSPSPRLQQSAPGAQDGSVNGSPVTIPNTPKTAGGEKKKKETRGRKNSKATNANKTTPVMASSTIPHNGNTPSAQVQTPASSSMPTPGRGMNTNEGALNPDARSAEASSVFDPPMTAPRADIPSDFATSAPETSSNSMANNDTGNTSMTNNDDLSQMFSNNDMSQFLHDFDFSGSSFSGGGQSTGDATGLGNFGDSWDGSSLGNLFGDSLS